MVFVLGKGLGTIWEIIKVTRRIQEAKIIILKWIKFRDNSDKPHKIEIGVKQKIIEVGTAKGITQD